MDSRHQRNLCQIVHKIQKNIQNPHKTAATGRGGTGDARAHASPGKTKRRRPLTQKETEGAAPLLHSWSTDADPHEQSLTRCTTRRWTRSLGEQAAYVAPSREAVGNDGGDHEAEVIRLVLYRRLRKDERGGSNAIR